MVYCCQRRWRNIKPTLLCIIVVNVGSMLGIRLRRWPDNKLAMVVPYINVGLMLGISL